MAGRVARFRKRTAARIRLFGKNAGRRLERSAENESAKAQEFFHATRAWETVPHNPNAIEMVKFNRVQNINSLNRAKSARRTARVTGKLSRAIARLVRGKTANKR